MIRTHMTWVVLLLVIFAVTSSMIIPSHSGSGNFKAQRIVRKIEKDVGIEGFEEKDEKKDCPDLLVREGAVYYLFNSKQPRVPGVNPIQFESLNGYREYVRWQRSLGKRCPVLKLQHSHTIGGIKRQNGNAYIGNYTYSPQDVQQRRESIIRFSRDHTEMCGEGSIIDKRFCMKDDFDEYNRGPEIVNGKYITKLDGIIPSRHNGVYPFDPMNQYIGVRTQVDD